MFIGLSKTLARFGKFRIGVGLRLTKENAFWMLFALIFVWIFQLLWYLLIFCFWLIYVIYYGIFWCIKKLVKWCAKKLIPAIKAKKKQKSSSLY